MSTSFGLEVGAGIYRKAEHDDRRLGVSRKYDDNNQHGIEGTDTLLREGRSPGVFYVWLYILSQRQQCITGRGAVWFLGE